MPKGVAEAQKIAPTISQNPLSQSPANNDFSEKLIVNFGQGSHIFVTKPVL